MYRNLNYKGFTLTELLIVILITSILAAAGLPGYKSYITEQRRNDAVVALQNAQIKIAEHLLNNDKLPAYTTADVMLDTLGISATSPAGFYNITLPSTNYSNTTNSYEIKASAVGQQADDLECALIFISDKLPRPMPEICR